MRVTDFGRPLMIRRCRKASHEKSIPAELVTLRFAISVDVANDPPDLTWGGAVRINAVYAANKIDTSPLLDEAS